MPTVLITGVNRGLGLEFCRQYAAKDWNVIACCRNPNGASELNELCQRYNKVQVEALDVADFCQIDTLAKKLSDTRIDVLINNAGIYGDSRDHSFGQLDYKAWLDTLITNTQAPIKMVEAFLPQLKQGNNKLIVNISSLMGSLADNNSGGSLLYRSSKAALNAAMKSLSIDLKAEGIGVLILHPGWVQTDMGGVNALIDSKTSVAGMCSVIENFTLGPTDIFVNYDGKAMPW